MVSTMAHGAWSVAWGILALVFVAKIVRRIVWHRRMRGMHGFGRLAFAGGAATEYGACRSRGGGFGARRLGRSRWLRAVFHRLDTTPGQEREIRAALEDLVDRAQDARGHAFGAREGLARAIAGDAFDDAAFEATSARVDATRAQLEDAVRGALRRVHGVLDGHQRARLAALLEHGFWGARLRTTSPRGGGPYRDGDVSGTVAPRREDDARGGGDTEGDAEGTGGGETAT